MAQGDGTEGPETFLVHLTDPVNATIVRGTIEITIQDDALPPENHPPIARRDASTTPPGVPVLIDVMENDHDPDGDDIRPGWVGDDPDDASVLRKTALGGTVEWVGNEILYTPPDGGADMEGEVDSFRYTIWDGELESTPARVTVHIHTPPEPPLLAVADTLPDVARRDEYVIGVSQLLSNDGPTGAKVSRVDGTSELGGIVRWDGETITYLPPAIASSRTELVNKDSFTYTITNDSGDSSTAEVTLGFVWFDKFDGVLAVYGTSDNDRVEVLPNRVFYHYTEGGKTSHVLGSGIDKVVFLGGDGNDRFTNKTTLPSLVYGGDGDDRITGGDGDDEFHGGAGNDRIDGNGGNDRLSGDDGEDKIRGGNGRDELHGDGGDDVLFGGKGDDELRGGTGDDTLHGDNGHDHIFGDEGNDTLWGDNKAGGVVAVHAHPSEVVLRQGAGWITKGA